MSEFKVSILMTAYNAENYIKDAILSIVKQRFKNWNLILVDDKSTDRTLEIVKSFKNKRIKIYKLNKHQGRTRALNYGLKKCKTKLVAIQDADDLSLPNRLYKQVDFLKKNKEIKMVAGWAIKIDNLKRKIGEIKVSKVSPRKNISLLLGKEFVPHSTVMFCLASAKKFGGYPPKLKYAQDFGLILKFIKANQLYVIPNFISKIRVVTNSMSFRHEYKNIIIKDHLSLLNYVNQNFPLNIVNNVRYFFYIFKNYIKLANNFILKFKKLLGHVVQW